MNNSGEGECETRHETRSFLCGEHRTDDIVSQEGSVAN